MDLMSVTAPMTIRYPDGTRHLIVEKFVHPQGLLYFEPFWHSQPGCIHLAEGQVRGEGPWKVGDAVVTVTGCRGADPEMALQLAAWQEHLACCDGDYVAPAQRLETARQYGAAV